jgi:carbon-monoxide dehydrogenase small subunit
MNENTTLNYRLKVNGLDREVCEAGYTETLLHVLRYRMGLTGTKESCEDGRCGACTVLIDGQPVNSCIELAAEAQGTEITTIEGYNRPDGKLTALQRAFVKHAAVQCGYCIPGLILAAEAFLRENPGANESDIRNGMDGNLCRCTGYTSIIVAIAEAAKESHAS